MPVAPPTFRPKGMRSKRQANAEYDARRGSARSRGYGAQWDAASTAFKQVNPLCLGCRAVGRTVACEVTDHVVPHKGNMTVFWDMARWQPSCNWHHAVVKQKLEALFLQGRIVEAELWLNSATAIELTKRIWPPGG